nr:hypothetical protein Iba_chr12dCG18180 [Ipomoea batatas]
MRLRSTLTLYGSKLIYSKPIPLKTRSNSGVGGHCCRLLMRSVKPVMFIRFWFSMLQRNSRRLATALQRREEATAKRKSMAAEERRLKRRLWWRSDGDRVAENGLRR